MVAGKQVVQKISVYRTFNTQDDLITGAPKAP